MTLYKRNKILFIVFIALLFFSPRLCNAADTEESAEEILFITCLLYTSPSPRDGLLSRMPSSA